MNRVYATTYKIWSKISIAISLSFALALSASANDKSDFDEASRLGSLGHYGEAARLLREVQRHRPNDPYVLCELAAAYMNNYNDVKDGVDKAEMLAQSN